jgi:hypothetical protein
MISVKEPNEFKEEPALMPPVPSPRISRKVAQIELVAPPVINPQALVSYSNTFESQSDAVFVSCVSRN